MMSRSRDRCWGKYRYGKTVEKNKRIGFSSAIAHALEGLSPFVIKFKDRRYPRDLDLVQDLMRTFMNPFLFGVLLLGGCIKAL